MGRLLRGFWGILEGGGSGEGYSYIGAIEKCDAKWLDYFLGNDDWCIGPVQCRARAFSHRSAVSPASIMGETIHSLCCRFHARRGGNRIPKSLLSHHTSSFYPAEGEIISSMDLEVLWLDSTMGGTLHCIIALINGRGCYFFEFCRGCALLVRNIVATSVHGSFQIRASFFRAKHSLHQDGILKC